jgi:hypothetical protein
MTDTTTPEQEADNLHIESIADIAQLTATVPCPLPTVLLADRSWARVDLAGAGIRTHR